MVLPHQCCCDAATPSTSEGTVEIPRTPCLIHDRWPTRCLLWAMQWDNRSRWLVVEIKRIHTLSNCCDSICSLGLLSNLQHSWNSQISNRYERSDHSNILQHLIDQSKKHRRLVNLLEDGEAVASVFYCLLKPDWPSKIFGLLKVSIKSTSKHYYWPLWQSIVWAIFQTESCYAKLTSCNKRLFATFKFMVF